MQPRCVQWAEIDGRKYHVVGGKLAHAVVNPTWNPIAKPGAMYEYFRGNPNDRNPIEMLRDREPLPAHYMDHDARVAKMDAPGPRGDVAVPDARRALRGAAQARHRGGGRRCSARSTAGSTRTGARTTRAHLRARRTSRSPTSTWRCRELEWALAHGARVVVMRPAAVWTRATARARRPTRRSTRSGRA